MDLLHHTLAGEVGCLVPQLMARYIDLVAPHTDHDSLEVSG